MYSYEDRIRAVKLYVKLGKRTAATIRQLGYPTKNSLKSWHEEYRRDLDLSAGYSSYLGKINPARENQLDRDFRAAAPNDKWLTDVTEFQLHAGKVYLSPMIGCFDGLVVSWSIGTRPGAELVNTMLDGAVETIASGNNRPVVYSDRGAHYRWPGWLTRIGKAKLIRSVSRKGCSPDNAACESFFGRLKTELFYPRNWRSTTIEQVIEVLHSYIRWYNAERIKISWALAVPSNIDAALGSWLKTSPKIPPHPPVRHY